jgi:hypothetical protein
MVTFQVADRGSIPCHRISFYKIQELKSVTFLKPEHKSELSEKKILPHLKKYTLQKTGDDIGSEFLILPPVVTMIDDRYEILTRHECKCESETIPQNICDSDKSFISIPFVFEKVSLYDFHEWEFVKMCNVYEFEILWALAVDFDAIQVLNILTDFNFRVQRHDHLYLIRDIYGPACKLIFPHLSPEQNTNNQLKRFKLLVHKISEATNCRLDLRILGRSIVLDLADDLGYDLCKDVLIRFLFPYPSSYELHHIFKYPQVLRINLLMIAKSQKYHLGLRCFIEYNNSKYPFHQNYFMHLFIMSIHVLDMVSLQFFGDETQVRSMISKVKQCFLLYSIFFSSHKIIQNRVLANLQYKESYLDPNVVRIIASFLSLVKYENPHKIEFIPVKEKEIYWPVFRNTNTHNNKRARIALYIS